MDKENIVCLVNNRKEPVSEKMNAPDAWVYGLAQLTTGAFRRLDGEEQQ